MYVALFKAKKDMTIEWAYLMKEHSSHAEMGTVTIPEMEFVRNHITFLVDAVKEVEREQ